METIATPVRFLVNPVRETTEDERALLSHVSRWGSDGYPVAKSGSCWVWNDWRSVKGSPTVYKTKRAAVAAFEKFHDLLLDSVAWESWKRDIAQAVRP